MKHPNALWALVCEDGRTYPDDGAISDDRGMVDECLEDIIDGSQECNCKNHEIVKYIPAPPPKEGEPRYYWQYSEPEGDTPAFIITPKEYFDAEGYISDIHWEAQKEASKDLPKGFHSLMESYFEFEDGVEAGIKILKENPLFEEKKMVE